MTTRQRMMQEIIEIICGSIIPVSFTHADTCTVKSKVFARGDRIVKVVPQKFIFSYKMNYWDDVFTFLTPDQKIVWKNFSLPLFSVLHEIGHTQTLVGLSISEMDRAKKNVRVGANSYFDICANYRKIHSEFLADQWATDWVLEHTELAKAIDKKLSTIFS